MARSMLYLTFMRSILVLFLIAGLGFAIILKKDAPQPVASKKRPDEFTRLTKHNWVKPAFDQHSVAKTVVSQGQENQLP